MIFERASDLEIMLGLRKPIASLFNNMLSEGRAFRKIDQVLSFLPKKLLLWKHLE